MIHSKSFLFIIITVLFSSTSAYADNNIWHQLINFQSHVTTQDYTENVIGDKPAQPFTLTIYRHHFRFVFPLDASSNSYTYQGTVTQSDTLSISGNTFILDGPEVQGKFSSELNHGIKWTYKLEIPSRKLSIKRQQIRYFYLIWLLLLIFMTGGFMLFPLVDKARNKVLYNIKKRTHPLFQYTILIKIIWLWSCFLLSCYYTLTNVQWYWIIFVLTIELFTITPSLIQAMYFFTTMQRHVKQMNCFKDLSVTVKCILMSLLFISIPVVSLGSLFFSKGIYVYFGLSAAVLAQFIYSCKQKKYTFSRVIFYDIMLTALLTVFGTFQPSLNFTILTFKDMAIFWNFYIGLFVFGILLSRRLIKMELAQEQYVQEFSETLPQSPATAQTEPTDSQRRHELPEIKSNEVLK